jgi:hypothetical protein
MADSPPVCRHLLVAQKFLWNPGTEPYTLVNVVPSVRWPGHPFRLAAVSVVGQMTDAEGTFEFTLTVEWYDTGARVAHIGPTAHTFRDRLAAYPFHFRLTNLPIAVPGWYEFRLFRRGVEEALATQTLMCREARIP